MYLKLRRFFVLRSAIIICVSLFCGCDRPDCIYYDISYDIQTVYDASVNVYTGTLLGVELYEEGFYGLTDTYLIKVKVKEVIKGDFKEGDIIEDLCPKKFTDLGCDYLFMTGLNIDYGYFKNSYEKCKFI